MIAPIEGGPAERLGLAAGDVIATIDGETTESMTLDEAVSRLKGPAGTAVRLGIRRRGREGLLEVAVERAELPQSTVRYSGFLAPGTAWLRLTEFTPSTGEEVAEALARLRREGMKRLLLDLRNNGGGNLESAIATANLFLPTGALVVETRGRVARRRYEAPGGAPAWDLPLVVLVNRGTASAAELVTGALQDHDVALVAGTRTWGKGLVQTVIYRCNGSALSLTTSRYHTPSGRVIQRPYDSYFDYFNPEDEEAPDDGPIFRTALGREVRGGGGITPDVIAPTDSWPEAAQRLLLRTAFIAFAAETGDGGIDPDWEPDAAMLDEFLAWARRQGIEVTADDEGTARAIRVLLRAAVLRRHVGDDAAQRALAQNDPQIQRAQRLLDEAAALAARRRALAEPPFPPRDEEAPRPADPAPQPATVELRPGQLLVGTARPLPSGADELHDPFSAGVLAAAPGGAVGVLVPRGAGGLVSPGGMALGPDGRLCVTDAVRGAVFRLDGTKVEPLVPAGTLRRPGRPVFGPDGRLYVPCLRRVLRFDGATGEALGAVGEGTVAWAYAAAFAPDGALCVTDRYRDAVICFGKEARYLVRPGAGGLVEPTGLAFAPDGSLCVASHCTSRVIRYDGKTGAPLGDFVATASGGMLGPTDLAFAPDGDLYVAGNLSCGVYRYDGKTGAFLGRVTVAADAPAPCALLFVPR